MKKAGKAATGRKRAAKKKTAPPNGARGATRPAEAAVVTTLEPVTEPTVGTYGLVDPDGRPRIRNVLGQAGLSVEGARSVYRTMCLTRALDDRMMKHQRQGRIGFYGAATGQEAVPAAVAEALEDRDWIFPALREGPAMLHRGYDLVTYLCQIFGNAGDALKGRNMPSHMADRRVNQVSWSSVIGPQITQATGAAYAAKLRGDDVVCAAFMGDGATSSADFHTGLNFAAVWKVPAVFVCQNNQWSISVPTRGQTASATLAQKALAYGMPGFRVDGNDATAVFHAVHDAAGRARAGGGPSFVECMTYRIGAHSSSDDPRVYRDEAEVDVWRARDPVSRLRAFLLSEGHLDEAEDAGLQAALTEEVAAAVKEAEALGDPARGTLFTDVYATPPWHLREQADDFERGS